jgi:hypothetical protein
VGFRQRGYAREAMPAKVEFVTVMRLDEFGSGSNALGPLLS